MEEPPTNIECLPDVFWLGRNKRTGGFQLGTHSEAFKDNPDITDIQEYEKKGLVDCVSTHNLEPPVLNVVPLENPNPHKPEMS